MLSGFWLLRGWEGGGLRESVKKGKFVMRLFLQLMLNEVLKIFEQQYRTGDCILMNFHKKYLQNLKCYVNKACTF